MEPQGWVIIGTKLDSKQFEKDLNNQRRELKNYEKEAEQLLKQKTNAEEDLTPYKEELALIKEMTDEMLEKVQTEAEVNNILELEQRQVNELKEKYSSQLGTLNDINAKLEENSTKQELIKTKVNETMLELDKAKRLDNINVSINKISHNLTNVIKKVGRWALAIFGIRGAYMAVRNAINVISQDDEKLKADITYIKNVFAYALEPVVRKIIELAKQLLYYIAYIIKMWTGYDIFANANKNLKKATGSAKELKKQLAGFDEMNVLSDSSGSGGGISTQMNLSDFDAPKWLKLLGKYGKVILPILGGIFAKLFKIKKLGILIALYGIYEAIKGIIEFARDPNFQSLIKIIEGIAITLIGIGATIGAWPVLIAGVLILIVAELVKNYEKIKEKINDLKNWLNEHVLEWLKNVFGEKIGTFLYTPIKVAIDIIEDLFDGLIGGLKKIIEGIVKIFKGDFVGGIKDIFNGLLSILLAPFKAWYDTVKGWLNGILDLFGLVKDEKNHSIGGGGYGFGGGGGGGGRAKGGIFYPSKLPKLAVGGIINQPGRGMPYHGAYVGERGAEAVVPLTDSQQMALLGETIGKYVNINATVPVYVGNRLVARELKRINAEDDFAYNR